MPRFLRFITLCSIVLALVFSVRAAEEKKKVRILGIGNSFTVNATKFLPQIFKSDKDIDIDIAFAQIGGCSLERHVNVFTTNEKEPDNPKGKIYGYKLNSEKYQNGKSLKEVLQDGKWDYVTIQQVSWKSPDSKSYMPFAKQLYDYIKKYQPDTTIVFHETWAYEKEPKKNFDQDSMYKNLHASYGKIAKELDVAIIPVGTAFQNARKLPLWTFEPLKDFDEKSVNYPDKLPVTGKSLNRGYYWRTDSKDKTKKVVANDTHHASQAGEYLGGLVWYKFFTGKSPLKITYKPAALSQEQADSLKKVADEVVIAK